MHVNAYLVTLVTFALLAAAATDTPVKCDAQSIPYQDLFPNSDIEGSPNCTVQDDPNKTEHKNGGTASITFNGTPSGTNSNTQPFGDIIIDSPKKESVSSMAEQSNWVMVGCDPNSDQAQNVLAYCSKSMNATDSGCADVFEGEVENTIVSMPQDCGLGPYARITKLEPHPDQDLASKFAKEDKPADEPVYHLQFDYRFSQIPEEKGPVYMRIDSANMDDYNKDIIDSSSERRAWLEERGLWEEKSTRKRWFWDDFVQWLQKVTTVTTENKGASALRWDQKFNVTELYDKSVGKSGKIEGSLDFEVYSRALMNVKYGYYLQGSIVPPVVNYSYVYFFSDAEIGVDLSIVGKAKASYESTRLSIGNFGFPALSVPGIITLGPNINVEAYLSGSLTLHGEFNSSFTAKLPEISMAFGDQHTDDNPTPINDVSTPTPIPTFKASADFGLSGDLSVHVVPAVQFGVNVLDGTLIDAEAYVEADVSAGGNFTTTVRTGEAPIACVGPYVGVLVDAGLKGKLLYWKTSTQPIKIYQHTFDFPELKLCTGQNKRDLLSDAYYVNTLADTPDGTKRGYPPSRIERNTFIEN